MVEPILRHLEMRAVMSPALFRADWIEALFIHFVIDPRELQPLVPLKLDTFEGDAFVSLVAFTQKRLRLCQGGRFSQLLTAPLASHEFLNLRTYVRHRGERGIYFISEWIPNRLAVLIGPRTYGLPYRLGRLRYNFDPKSGCIDAHVHAHAGEMCCRANVGRGKFEPAAPSSLDEFLLERYVAFTCRRSILRRFQVDHLPWPQQRVHLEHLTCPLLAHGAA